MLQLLGRLHPLVVHFPIALLIAAALAEFLRPRRAGAAGGPSAPALFCLVLGAASAVVAALSGWLFAAHDPPGMEAILFRHRWTGVAVAVVASGTAWLALRWRSSEVFAAPARVGMLISLGLVSYSAHLGGAMVYGEGFLLEVLRGGGEDHGDTEDAEAPQKKEATAVRGDPVSASGIAGERSVETTTEAVHPPAVEPAPAAPVAAIDFGTQIRPILEARCYECHGEKRKPKGNLKLSDMGSVFAREGDERVILPGDPDGSPLYQRITLPADHEDAMPAKGDRLTAEQIGLIRDWIEQGARWEEPARTGASEPAAGDEVAGPEPGPESAPPEAGPALTLALTEGERLARDAALERLRAAGALAVRVSATSEEVEASLAVTPQRAGDAELALLTGLEPCLVELDLSRTAVQDEGLARLAPFTRLRRLRLGYTGIGDPGLAQLARLEALESLNLFRTAVTDSGLVHLRGLARLRRLYTGESAVSEAGANELCAVLPGLVIDRGVLPSFDAAAEREGTTR